MIVPIFDIDVQINSTRISTETVDDLRQLHDYLGKFITWLEHAPEFSSVSKPIVASQFPTEQADSDSSLMPELSESASIQPSRLTTGDYAILSLGFSGGAASYSNAVNKALSLGWQTRATEHKNIARTFEVMARQRGDLINVGKGIMALTEAGKIVFEKMRQSPPFDSLPFVSGDENHPDVGMQKSQVSSIAVSDAGFVKRSFGNRAIDILVLAIFESGKPVGYSDAPALVQRYGWNALTDSANPKLLIISKARKYPELVTSTDGRFWLTNKGREHGQRVSEYLASRRSNTIDNEQPELFNTSS